MKILTPNWKNSRIKKNPRIILINSEAAWSALRYPSQISDRIDSWASFNFVHLAASNQVLPLGYSQIVSSFHMSKSRVAVSRATRSPVEKR